MGLFNQLKSKAHITCVLQGWSLFVDEDSYSTVPLTMK